MKDPLSRCANGLSGDLGDGGGYPDGIPAGKLPMVSRLVAVADTYDAITSDLESWVNIRKAPEAPPETPVCPI